MKKRLFFVLMAAAMLSLGLTGCNLSEKHEKEIDTMVNVGSNLADRMEKVMPGHKEETPEETKPEETLRDIEVNLPEDEVSEGKDAVDVQNYDGPKDSKSAQWYEDSKKEDNAAVGNGFQVEVSSNQNQSSFTIESSSMVSGNALQVLKECGIDYDPSSYQPTEKVQNLHEEVRKQILSDFLTSKRLKENGQDIGGSDPVKWFFDDKAAFYGDYDSVCYIIMSSYDEFGDDCQAVVDNILPSTTPVSNNGTVGSVSNSGNGFRMGTFEQDGNTNNGEEPIEWIVLTQDGDRQLIMAKDMITFRPMHKDRGEKYPTWDKSQLRAWLNNDFLNSAFTEEEKARILQAEVPADILPSKPDKSQGETTYDKVFVLSVQEAYAYLGSQGDRAAKASEAMRRKYGDDYVALGYWTRTNSGYGNIITVYANGEIHESASSSAGNEEGVRPAMWVTLN